VQTERVGKSPIGWVRNRVEPLLIAGVEKRRSSFDSAAITASGKGCWKVQSNSGGQHGR